MTYSSDQQPNYTIYWDNLTPEQQQDLLDDDDVEEITEDNIPTVPVEDTTVRDE